MRIKFICATIAISIMSTGASAGKSSVNVYISSTTATIEGENNPAPPNLPDSNPTPPDSNPTPPCPRCNILFDNEDADIHVQLPTDPQAGINTLQKWYEPPTPQIKFGLVSTNLVLDRDQTPGVAQELSPLFVGEDSVGVGEEGLKNMAVGTVNFTYVPLTNTQIENISAAGAGKILSRKMIGYDIRQTGFETEKTDNGLLSLKVSEINTVKLQPHIKEINDYSQIYYGDVQTDSKYFPENIDYEKQAAEHASHIAYNKAQQEKYKLLNEKWDKERLKNETLAAAPLYGKKMVLEYVIKINPKMMKTINCQGLTRTTYSSNQSLTIGSARLTKLLTGEVCDVIPLVIYDLVNEVTNYAYGGENPFKRGEMLDLASKSYEDLLNIIDDKNKEKADKMTAGQVKQILIQKIKTQANSNVNSGGSTAGGVAADGAAAGGSVEGHHHHEEGHHEEEEAY